MEKLLKQILTEMQDTRYDIKGLKSDMQDMKSDIKGLKSDMQIVKSDIVKLSDDHLRLEHKVDDIYKSVVRIEEGQHLTKILTP